MTGTVRGAVPWSTDAVPRHATVLGTSSWQSRFHCSGKRRASCGSPRRDLVRGQIPTEDPKRLFAETVPRLSSEVNDDESLAEPGKVSTARRSCKSSAARSGEAKICQAPDRATDVGGWQIIYGRPTAAGKLGSVTCRNVYFPSRMGPRPQPSQRVSSRKGRKAIWARWKPELEGHDISRSQGFAVEINSASYKSTFVSCTVGKE
ncbi:hypothetical protein GGR56DRAFT_643055 [Xylariaceae sp. FL0804]|nr:hypothetical protein GGR56DRAFT_643055 [Xylariaceae sp. FL0804]